MHPELINDTPYALSLLYVGREPDGLLHGVALVQGTWRIGRDGQLDRVALQPDPPPGGQWYGDPALTSLRLEPQTAARKLACDVVLLGHAMAPGMRPVPQLEVALRIGDLRKRALVFGNRELRRGVSGMAITAPQLFERMPLRHERAFGGWDRRHDDASQHRCEPRNPVGMGFRDARLPACEEALLPNIEDPEHLYQGPGSAPPPCGFGFVAAGWAPRAALAGTCDEPWLRTRAPLLPVDFDPRFHNAAAAGLVAPALRGDEAVHIEGMAPEGRCSFMLPATAVPWCRWSLRRRDRVSAPLALDTVIIDMDRHLLHLQWRGCHPLPDGPLTLQALEARLPAGVEPARTPGAEPAIHTAATPAAEQT